MSPSSISLVLLLLFFVAGSDARDLTVAPANTVGSEVLREDDVVLEEILDDIPLSEEQQQKFVIAKKMRDTIKSVKQLESAGVDRIVRFNFLHGLFLMANASAVIGQNTSRAAATLIRGFVQDSFNLVSIGAYLPRLIFLDAPTQFIELLRLYRTNQIRIPQDMDEAFDTILNFAAVARESQIAMNFGTPLLSFFPNVFRGAELLTTEVLYGVFGWLVPINPADVSLPSIDGLWNRWDTKSSTTAKYDDKRFKPPM